MLWSVDSCQNRVSADQYHLTVSRAHVLTHRGQVVFGVIRCRVTSFQMIAGSSFFLFIWNMFCFCAAQFKFWFKTDLGRENSASYYRQGRQLLLTLLTMVTRWSRSTSNLCSILNVVYFDSWSWQSFVSACDVFNCLFPVDAQNEIQLLLRVFCYSWLVGFWLGN